MDTADRRETTINTCNGLNHNVSTLFDRHPLYQPAPNKESELKNPPGSKACDPITVLDDDEPDAAEISYIDLENDEGNAANENYTAPTKQAVAGTQGLGFQSVAKNPIPCNNVQEHDPAAPTKRVTRPLFRALTKDDFPAANLQSMPENRGIGFKAWYGAHDFHHIGKNVPGKQQKAICRSPSIALYNEKRTKNTTRQDRDAPQFEMSVLNSKRKRTMGELGYDELISPAQIESPSEKLARMAKRRRKCQQRCDPLLQNADPRDARSAMELDHAYGHEIGRMTGENVELAVSPMVYESLDKHETVARVGDERNGPSVVSKSSPVGPYLSTESRRDHLKTQRREDPSNDYMDAYDIYSTHTTAQDRGGQEHGDGINAAYSSDCTSRKLKDRKARVGGPTNACGVFSPETKAPVKRSNYGAFHCPRCDSQFTTSNAVNYHFEGCVTRYGNPKSLKWNNHPSLEGEARRTVPASKVTNTIRKASQIATALEELTQSNSPVNRQQASGSVCVESQTTPTHVSIDTKMGISAPIANMRAPLQASETQELTLSDLPEVQPVVKAMSSSCKEPKLDQPQSPVEHRAIAGKGLSHKTLKRFQETGNWNHSIEVDHDTDEAQDEETEIPDIAHRYFVQKREWLETEEDAIESSMGPYHTMNEANAVAKAEVQMPQIDGFEGIHSKGWSYLYEQDEFGMQTHTATILEIHIETAVHRELTPANERVSIPTSAFLVAQRVYIVHELQCLPSPDNTASAITPHCQSLTHGVFTLLNKANERAAAEYLDTLTGNWGDSEYDLLKKAELKSELNKKGRVLGRENDCFRQEIKLDSDGFAKVWVEMVVVEGPRN